ncbi:helix-turn-helix domain-containing protein [Amycolatopsis alkalitolerans]|uniref:Winged helix-turn-helix transcriptional regulator n=1 Tax=Amycolatopsis alkalitolerans TaxID=2547244 RepID=A0A5C4M2I2_9PSEU|nr:hypothetical protein [Amycolatopsis alkalitolerans]TNC25822.1 hypothetical protein FG385_14375 [Amycolatopsis alkalitolerans]
MSGFDPELTGKGLGVRLAALRTALERYDGFAFRPGQAESTAPDDSAVADAALAFVVRALRTACDPVGWRILARLAAETTTTAELAAELSSPRIVAWEQVNDLVQVGLVSRELDGDQVRLTEAGHGIVELVELMAWAAAGVVAP